MTAESDGKKRIQRDFDRDGFVVLPGFLSKQELEELRDHVEQCLREIVRGEAFPGVVKGLNEMDPWFEHQLHHGKQAELVSFLLDAELEPATAACFDRIPGESSGIKPHLDSIGARREGATIWIALERADRENGCLCYVKGTHKQDLPTEYDLEGFSAETEGAVAIEAEPGDAIVHNALTVHWSEANQSQRSRKAVSYFYWKASELSSELSSGFSSGEDVSEQVGDTD